MSLSSLPDPINSKHEGDGQPHPDLETSIGRHVGRSVPGLSVAVVDGDGTHLVSGFGHADLASWRVATPRTVYMWFSMTKIVTATAVMQLAERGLLRLDDAVMDHVPWFAARTRSGEPVVVTIRHLLSHSAGLANPLPVRWVHPAETPGPDERSWSRGVLANHSRLKSRPGSTASYSNLGYLYLGEVIACASGRPYREYVCEHILLPLGMGRTDFRYREGMLDDIATGYQRRWSPMTPLMRLMLPGGILGPAVGSFVSFNRFYVDGPSYGGLIGPVDDASRFLRLHLNGGTLDGTRLLSPGSVAAMQRLLSKGSKLDVGLGWFRRRSDKNGGRYVEHLGGGGGFFNCMRLYQDRSLGVVVMGNATSYDIYGIVDSIARGRKGAGEG